MNDNDAARSMRIAAFLARYRNAGIFSGLDTAPGAAAPEQEAAPEADGTPEQFVHDLEAMGPAFVKIGQALSTRPDMVPPDFMAALERMQSDVAPVPFEQVRAQIESELGVRIGRMFADGNHDDVTAAKWFERAYREGPNASQAAEAMGRWMGSLAAVDPAAARGVAADYLRRFPNGPDAAQARELAR